MKKIFGFMLVAVLMYTFTACSDDENEGKYGSPSSVQITSANVLFEARASEGMITFTAPGDVTVRSSNAWCTTRLDGNTIYVNAETNDDLVNRSALITVKCGADSANVTVIQQGVLFRFANDVNEFAASSNDAQTLKIPFTTNVETSVTSNCDWMHLTIAENDTLLINLDANTTGHVRTGTFTYKAGGYVGEVPVSQFDFDDNIAGNATVYYGKTKDAAVEQSEATVITRNSITFGGYTVPVVFDDATMTFKLYAGNKIGTVEIREKKFDVVTVIGDDKYVMWSNTTSMSAKPVFNEETGKTDIRFVDNGTFTGLVACAVLFYTFTEGESYTSSSANGSIAEFFNLRIER